MGFPEFSRILVNFVLQREETRDVCSWGEFLIKGVGFLSVFCDEFLVHVFLVIFGVVERNSQSKLLDK